DVAVGGELVGHRLDVVVDPEDLLNDHDATPGRAARSGKVGADLAGGRLKTDIFTHEKTSRLRAASDMVMRRRSTRPPAERGHTQAEMYIPKHFEASEAMGR